MARGKGQRDRYSSQLGPKAQVGSKFFSHKTPVTAYELSQFYLKLSLIFNGKKSIFSGKKPTFYRKK